MRIRYQLLLLAAAAGVLLAAGCAKNNPVADGGGGGRRILYYRAPMNPSVTSPVPAKDNMGMDFVPVHEGENGGASRVPGRAAIRLDARQQQAIGVRTEPVEVRDIVEEIRTYGRVAYDPDLYHAEQDYLSARDIASNGSLKRQDLDTARLLEASEIHLKVLGLNDAQIGRLKRSGQADPALLLGPLGTGKAWVYAEIYETDLPFVRVGQEMSLSAPAYPGKTFEGKVLAIDPVLDPMARTARVRSEIADPGNLLKPQLYVDATLHADLGPSLAVPREAVLDTGNDRYVFVAEGDGYFDPRKVQLGLEGAGYYQVLAGLKAGEQALVNGNFLVDSESDIQAAASAMTFYGAKGAGTQ